MKRTKVRRTLWVVSLVAAIGLVGAFAAMAVTGFSPRPQGAFDVRGNCYEAEHAADRECTGPQEPEAEHAASPSASPSGSASRGGDVSGNCDEAEHAADPECTDAGIGGTTSGDGGDDHSGRGRGRGGDD